METPYRNNQLLNDLVTNCSPHTQLCIACDITLETEFIKTKSIEFWKKNPIDLNKRPAVFLIN
jgi:16S rRNA (cytidine1402-2'-O)-methyltransferase